MIVGEFVLWFRKKLFFFLQCRVVSKANRAGTRGFRAPEVLLKCGAQTGGTLFPTSCSLLAKTII